jgi:hypothetical protein
MSFVYVALVRSKQNRRHFGTVNAPTMSGSRTKEANKGPLVQSADPSSQTTATKAPV